MLDRNPNWPGPHYFRRAAWHRDLLDVTRSLAAIARANHPLARGMGALLAREGGRAENGKLRSRKLQLRILYGLLVFMAALLLAIGLTFDVRRELINPIGRWLMYDAEVFMKSLAALLHLILIPFLIRMYIKRRYRKRQLLLAALLRRLNNGEPLSEAMRKLHRFFPPHHADLVATGERTGQLADCLTQLESISSTRLLETQGTRLPFGYLTLVLLSTVAITTFSYIKIHPVFVEVLKEFGVEAKELQHVYPLEVFEFALSWCLNPPLDLPEKLIWYSLPVLFVVAFRLFLRRPRVVSSLLRIPWFGHTATLRSLHHASLLLGRELEAGIPMVEALGHVAAADIPAAYRRVFERVRARLQQGETMGDALREARHGFPPGFVCFVELGEQSGQLPQALKQVAQLYWPVIQARQRITRTVTLCTCVLAVSALVLVVVETTFALNVAIIDACFYAL